MFEDIFANKRVNPEKLLRYGFKEKDGGYEYICEIMSGGFTLYVYADKNGLFETKLTDNEIEDEYVVYKTSATGEFAASVRYAVTEVLEDIAAKTCERSVFKYEQSVKLIEYAVQKYGGEPEYLWQKFPDNCVLRRSDNQKWYAGVFAVNKSSLGLSGNGTAEVVNLRTAPENMQGLLAKKGYFKGWHMNKKYWYSVILDGTVPFDEICSRLDESYVSVG